MRHIVGLLSVMLTCFALTTLHAAAASIEGSWIGSGTVGYRGTVDQVRCRVRYTKSSEKSYAVSSVCATAKGSYEINGRVTNTGGNRQSDYGPSREPAVGDRNKPQRFS